MAVDIADVKRWICTNLRCIRSINDIAAAFRIPPDTLRKQFVRTERTPISTFVTSQRVEHAKTLLSGTQLRCFEVAYETGFSREDVAARTFRKIAGETMASYRRHHGNRTGRNVSDVGLAVPSGVGGTSAPNPLPVSVAANL